MNKQEVQTLIELLKLGWPNTKAYDDPNISRAWLAFGLEDLPFGPVMKAIRAALSASRWGDFPPTIKDVIGSYYDELPKVPADYESLSDKSQIKHAIDMRVNKRHPEVDPKRQFRDIEEHQEALAINRQQRLKYRNELFKEVKPEVQRLMNSGMKGAQIVAQVFGVEYVKPELRKQLEQGTNDVMDLAKSLAKALPGASNG